jgi:cellulose synthase (UDP-forming)
MESLRVHRRAAPVRFRDRLVLGGLVLLGVHAAIYFLAFWFRPGHAGALGLWILLSAALAWGVARILVGWYNLLGLRQPEHVPAGPGLRVAIFIPASPGEPPPMFDETLAAAARIAYPHTTYLLDDSLDPAIARIADRHGAVRLELIGLPGAKAGKVNAALRLTTEDYVLVLDPDHIPFPCFLDRVLGHFRDPGVGFVQVSQAYGNAGRSFVARSAAEQTYAFYGPTLQGMYGHGTSVAIGANATFRRAALESIGGHGLGLAEDLVTSLRLHAAGWKGIYVPEVVSRGLVPEDLGSFVKQQLKWSRGVGEVLLVELPRALSRLAWRQRLSYLMIGTYYLFGATAALYNALPLLYLAFGWLPARVGLVQFVQHAAPLGLLGTAIYVYAQRFLCDPERERGLHLSGMLLKLGLFPVYLLGALLTLLRVDVPYIPTPKTAQAGRFFRLAWPALLLLSLTAALAVRQAWYRLHVLPEAQLLVTAGVAWGMIGFALVNATHACAVVVAAWQAARRKGGGS